MTIDKLLGVATAMLTASALSACNLSPDGASAAKSAAEASRIADAIKADQAQAVADFNAHDAVKAVSHDAPDYVGMVHGQPNLIGPAADLAVTQKMFAAFPDARLTVADQTVDVAASGEMAVFRGSYRFTLDDPKSGKPVTATGNYLAGYRLQQGGSWKITWSVDADTSPPTALPN